MNSVKIPDYKYAIGYDDFIPDEQKQGHSPQSSALFAPVAENHKSNKYILCIRLETLKKE